MHNIINHISIFEEQSGTFFFNPYNFSTVFCLNPLSDIIKAYIKDKRFDYKQYIENTFPASVHDKFCSFMETVVQSPLTDVVDYSRMDKEEMQLAELSFPTIHDCNLRCRYCFAKSGQNYDGEVRVMTKEIAEKAIYFLVNEFAPNAKSYKISFVSGGEPFLNLEIIKHVHEVVNQIKKSQNKSISIWVCTNGTILNEEILAFFRDTGQQIGISIDGPQEFHDNNRIFADGTGSYEAVKKNIETIIHDASVPNATKRIWGLTVLNKQNLDILKIIKNHKNLGIKDIQIKFARSNHDRIGLGYDDLLKIKKEYLKLSSEIIKTFKAGDISLFWMIANDTDYFGKFLKRMILKTPVFYRCNAARRKIAITVDGDIYPCDSFVGNPEFYMGNISGGTDKRIRDMFSGLNVLSAVKCKNCWARFLCGGDCYHNSYLKNGCIQEADSFMCDVLQYLCELAIKTVSILYFSNHDTYEKLYNQLLIRTNFIS